MRLVSLFFLFAGFICVHSSNDLKKKENSKRILVIGDSSVSSSHSLLLAELKKRGRVSRNSPDDKDLRLKEYGEFIFDLVLLVGHIPSLKIDIKEIVEFIDAGRDVFIAGDGSAVRDLAKEVGVSFDAVDSKVVDHFSFDESDAEGSGDHSLIIAGRTVVHETITGRLTKPIVYSGTAHKINDPSNKLVTPVLMGSHTAYSVRPQSAPEAPPPTPLVLLSVMQARNNARVVVGGGGAIVADALFKKNTGNEELMQSLVAWTLHERGQLRIRDIVHHKKGQNSTAMYRVKDEFHFQAIIEEFKNNQWVPFQAEDIQMEFTMLDPYIRTNLKNNKNGLYTADFTIPDVYGIFQIKIDHRRTGFSYLQHRQQVTVRPYRHDEFERFLPTAYPYYAVAFGLMGGVFVTGVAFLYSADAGKEKKN